MGQRLVTIIKRSEESTDTLAVLYHHWSAYTVESYKELKNIIDGLYSKLEVHDDDFSEFSDRELQLALIRCVEDAGGGISGGKGSDEFKYISGLFPEEEFKTEDISRNDGLIALSREKMQDLINWAEGTAEIYIDDATFYSGVWWGYDKYEEYAENTEEESLIPEDKMVKVDFSFSENLPFEEIDHVISTLENLDRWYIKDVNNTIVEITG